MRCIGLIVAVSALVSVGCKMDNPSFGAETDANSGGDTDASGTRGVSAVMGAGFDNQVGAEGGECRGGGHGGWRFQ